MPTPKQPPPNRPENRPARSIPKLLFSWEDWLPYMDGFDGTDAEKRQFIETLWSIILSFVDLGWDVATSAPESSGQVIDLTAELRAAMVQSNNQHQSEREKARESV